MCVEPDARSVINSDPFGVACSPLPFPRRNRQKRRPDAAMFGLEIGIARVDDTTRLRVGKRLAEASDCDRKAERTLFIEISDLALS